MFYSLSGAMSTACKPGSVPPRPKPYGDGHSSGTFVTERPRDRPERRCERPTRRRCERTDACRPTWSCSRWGLPCSPVAGAAVLLPHHFTLAPWPDRAEDRRCVSGTFGRPARRYPAPCLRGRTFLPRIPPSAIRP